MGRGAVSAVPEHLAHRLGDAGVAHCIARQTPDRLLELDKGQSNRFRPARQLSCRDLVEKLGAIGIRETEANLRNKISRDGFTGAFLIQCLYAMGVGTVHLYEPD